MHEAPAAIEERIEMFYAVIMAGGSGTRFWPASRAAFPKQLISLAGRTSLLQSTVQRLEGVVPAENVYIVTSESHSQALRGQVPEIPEENILVEPVGRNTAPCVGLAALQIRRREPEAAMICMPADHVVNDTTAWKELLRVAHRLVRERGRVVTFGIPPTRPETAFGYIRFGGQLQSAGPVPIHRVEAFTEKPDLETARAFLQSGNCFWNSGLVAWRVDTCLDLMQRHLPAVRERLEELDLAMGSGRYPHALAQIYPRLPSVSLDYGILEHAEDILGIPADIGWSDVGSWSALPEVLPADESGNVSVGIFLGIDTADCVAYAPGRLVATIGIRDLIVVATGDALLVCHKDRAQDVKRLVDRLEKDGLGQYL
ncbi:MAG: mannose-1-phosphate guanylyltransferase [Candidatus Wallbacteria bacterium]|nr:mannose-1-phosphate guanylyltransferase [Candidatus Wallbacteria bacterium]